MNTVQWFRAREVLLGFVRWFALLPSRILEWLAQRTGLSALQDAVEAHRPHRAFKRELQLQFKELMIIIVSIIQGLIFTSIADKLIKLTREFVLVDLGGIILCTAILLRIFQTHLLAAYRYVSVWDVHVIDFVLIFVIGMFEYVLFSYVDPGKSDYQAFYFVLLCFSILGSLGYLRAYFAIRDAKYAPAVRTIELMIQKLNIGLSAAIALPCLLVLWSSSHQELIFMHWCGMNGQEWVLVIAHIMTLGIVSMNIYTSTKLSFAT